VITIMKRKLLLFTTLLLTIGYACKKDKFEETNLPVQSTITIGNSSGMVLTTHDTTLSGKYNAPAKTYEIDLNNDLISDIQFSNSLWGSPGSGMHPTCVISCLNSAVGLYGSYKGDTIFNYTTKDTFNFSRVEIYIRHYYKCTRTYPTDSIYMIKPDKFVVPVLKKGSILKSGNLFKEVELIASHADSTPPPVIIVKTDTVIYDSKIYFSQCDNFPQNEVSYVGFKMRINDTEKIGWLKILIASGGYSMTVLESAIQQ
jgi:hypothetical protein